MNKWILQLSEYKGKIVIENIGIYFLGFLRIQNAKFAYKTVLLLFYLYSKY